MTSDLPDPVLKYPTLFLASLAMEQLREKLGVQKTSFSNMKQSSLRIFVVEISNTSLISDLTTKIGDKALYILRIRAHSFVAENWAALADNWAHERRVIFVITRAGEKRV